MTVLEEQHSMKVRDDDTPTGHRPLLEPLHMHGGWSSLGLGGTAPQQDPLRVGGAAFKELEE